MAGTIRVYSTFTNSTKYCEYSKPVSEGGMPVLQRYVTIGGGAGVAKGRALVTPLGVATEISSEELEFLEKSSSFQRHKRLGFVTVVKGNPDPDKVAADMSQRDGSAPLVPNDYKDAKAPKAATDTAGTPPTTKPRFQKTVGQPFK